MPEKQPDSEGSKNAENTASAATAALESLESWLDMVEGDLDKGRQSAPTTEPRKNEKDGILEQAGRLEKRIELLEATIADAPKRQSSASRRLRWRIFLALILLTPYFWLWLAFDQEAGERQRAALFWRLSVEKKLKPEERAQLLLDLAALGQREWRSAKTYDLNLAGANLEKASLSQANLRGARLREARLALADLSYANLRGVDFTRATLHGCNLRETFLNGTNFTSADATRADFSGSLASQSSFTRAVLSDANFTKARLRDTNFTESSLTNARFLDANLTNTDFSRARIGQANFRNAALENSQFVDTNWWEASGFTSTQLELLEAQFSPTEEAPEDLRARFEKWKSE